MYVKEMLGRPMEKINVRINIASQVMTGLRTQMDYYEVVVSRKSVCVPGKAMTISCYGFVYLRVFTFAI